MEKIAFISGETIYYWSSIVLTLATLTAICFFWSLYLGKGGNGVAAFSVVPLAIVPVSYTHLTLPTTERV